MYYTARHLGRCTMIPRRASSHSKIKPGLCSTIKLKGYGRGMPWRQAVPLGHRIILPNSREAQKVEYGRVHTPNGESYPVKQVKVVPLGAGSVASSGTAQDRKMLAGGSRILATLEQILQGVGQLSLGRSLQRVTGYGEGRRLGL